MLIKKLRNYKINFNFNSKYESILVPGLMYNNVLEQSKATIHIYLYLCLNANKNKDFGYFRNVKTITISKDLNIPLRTVQFSIKELNDCGFITRSYNNNKTNDIYINGYKKMVSENNYIKVPGEIVFSQEFLTCTKSEIVGFMSPYHSIYKDAIASMMQKKGNSNKENYELVDNARTSRELTEKHLLRKLKRVSPKHLDNVISTLKNLGLMDITEIGESVNKGRK